jgi:hypothetical protein
MEVNPNSKASVEFDLTRPLRFTRSGVTDSRTQPTAFIYSRAVDGVNGICVAKITIGLNVGLSNEQEQALVDRIADEIVAPGFSDEEIEDIAFEIMDIDDYHTTVTEHHRERARRLADNITTRRRLALSGAR